MMSASPIGFMDMLFFLNLLSAKIVVYHRILYRCGYMIRREADSIPVWQNAICNAGNFSECFFYNDNV